MLLSGRGIEIYGTILPNVANPALEEVAKAKEQVRLLCCEWDMVTNHEVTVGSGEQMDLLCLEARAFNGPSGREGAGCVVEVGVAMALECDGADAGFAKAVIEQVQ